MAKLTIVFGVILVLLGLVGYFGWEQLGAERQSPTALIPAFFGIPLVALGVLAVAKPNLRKHAMHGAVALALLGFFGTIAGLVKAIQWLAGSPPQRPAAVAIQAIMAVLSAIYVALCVRSFIDARRRRKAETPTAA